MAENILFKEICFKILEEENHTLRSFMLGQRKEWKQNAIKSKKKFNHKALKEADWVPCWI